MAERYSPGASAAKLPLPYDVSVCGLGEISQFADRGVTHLLSIDNPGGPAPTPDWFKGDHRHVVFHDVETDSMALQIGATGPGRADVETILDYAKACFAAAQSGKVHLLVHCTAGVSRSPAAAYCIMAMHLGPGGEGRALDHLATIRPQAFPNRLVVQLADEIMGRNGRLIQALDALRSGINRETVEWIASIGARGSGKAEGGIA